MTQSEGGREFCHMMQDITSIYLGARLTYGDMIEMDEIPFKLKALTGNYVLREAGRETSLAEHLRRMKETDLSYMAFKQLKMKVRYFEPRSGTDEKNRDGFVEKVCDVEEFVRMDGAVKADGRLVIEEVQLSKLGLMTMSL